MGGFSRRLAALCLAALFIQGCASTGTLDRARDQFYSGQTNEALATLDAEKISGRNRLLWHLDRGLIAHTSGDFQDSTVAFKAATRIIDELDFVSIREQSTSLLTNDWANSYRGEYSERLWLHSFQMMNYLLLEEPESAAVEARQALEIFKDHGDSLREDWFSRALIALSFEAVGQRDSAHIEYKKLFDNMQYQQAIAPLALHNARAIGRSDDAKSFAQAIGATTTSTAGPANVDSGELMVFIQNGSIPPKRTGDLFLSGDLRISFPFYPDRFLESINITATLDQQPLHSDVVSTQMLEVASSALAARGRKLAAKQVARTGVKIALAEAADAEDEVLGSIVRTLLFVLEQADTRSWETLPEHLSLMRIPLPPGEHDVVVTVNDGGRSHVLKLDSVRIRQGQRAYRVARLGAGSPL